MDQFTIGQATAERQLSDLETISRRSKDEVNALQAKIGDLVNENMSLQRRIERVTELEEQQRRDTAELEKTKRLLDELSPAHDALQRRVEESERERSLHREQADKNGSMRLAVCLSTRYNN